MFCGKKMEFKKNLAAFLVGDFDKENSKGSLESAGQTHNNDHDRKINSAHSSSAANERVLQDYNHTAEMEAVIVEDLIKPLIFLMKHFLPFHDIINHDPVARCCVLKKGSFLRKLFCVMYQLLVIYRLGLKVVPTINSDEDSQDSSGSGLNMTALAKGAYLIFITFSCVTFSVYWLQTNRICLILNHVIVLAERLHLHDRSPPRIKAVKVAVHGSWIFTTIYVIITVILYAIEILLPAITNEEQNEEQSSSIQAPLNASANMGKSNKYQLDFTEIHASDGMVVIQIVTALASFVNIFSWMLNFLHLGAWGLIFRQLIAIFYWRLRTKEELGQSLVIPHEIRTFNRIGSIIEDSNRIYGLACLLGAVVCVTYISPSIKHAFTGLSQFPQIGSGWHLMLSYIPMIVTTLMIAEIQRMAGSFAGIIKYEYGRYTRDCGDPAECLCGIAIVHYDLSTSNIGFKGLGFFTVSYQFITTIVSVIISYSILVVQLFPHDNSDIEV